MPERMEPRSCSKPASHREPNDDVGPLTIGRRTFLKGMGVTTCSSALIPMMKVNWNAPRKWVPGTASKSSSEVPNAWFSLVVRLEHEAAGFSPPVVARAFAYLGVALYEALLPGMPSRRSLAEQLNGLEPRTTPAGSEYHWPTVANSALATMVRRLFPTVPDYRRSDVHALERFFSIKGAIAAPASIYWRSVSRGRHVARWILEWSREDGGREGYLNNYPPYERPRGPGLWSPTPPTFSPALQPYWGDNRLFVLDSTRETDPGPPPEYSEQPSSHFYREALEVQRVGRHASAEQEEIARFWADDPRESPTPPSHLISIVAQVLEQNETPLDIAAEAYAKVGLAIADSFVCCWKTKYQFNLLRPVTYIRTLIDPTWTPLIYTPPFPEYTSGHSVQSAAAAVALTDVLGNVAFEDRTHAVLGLPSRNFRSFREMAKEAGYSRIYGGIHFRSAVERGLQQGNVIGRRVNQLELHR